MIEKVLGRGEKFLRETQTPYLVSEEREVLARFLARLESACSDAIRRVILYGSKARGNVHADSDTDVLIVVTDDAARDTVQALTRAGEFWDTSGFWWNWRVLTEEDYAEYRRLMMPFYVNVRRDGIELWDPAASLIEEIEYPLDFQEGVAREMTPETLETIRLHIEEARERWKAAEKLREETPLFAIPLAYYAVFYLVTAALYSVNVVRTKHEGVRSALNEFLVQPGLLEEEYKDIYQRLLDGRVSVDYRPFRPTQKVLTDDEARQLLGDAERLIARLEQLLRERGAIR